MTKLLGGIGIDISEHHIRVTEIGLFNKLKKTVELPLPDGVIVDERVAKAETLKQMIEELFQKEKIGQVRATLLLPESRIFSKSFLLPSSVKGDSIVIQALERAQRDIPIPFTQAVTSVSQGERTEAGVQTTVYAIERAVFNEFVQLFEKTSVNIVAVEANTKGIHRLLKESAGKAVQKKRSTNKAQKNVFMIADIGHTWATVSIYTPKGSNLYSRTISYRHVGSDIARQDNLSDNIVEIIVQAMGDGMIYCQEQNLVMNNIYLSGTEALDTSIHTMQKEEVFKTKKLLWVGDVISNKQLTKKKIHQFGPAIGAAIRSVHPFKYKHQHNFSQHHMQTKQKGFTLVELLVVIAIIGILVAIIFVALDPAARFGQARDAVRQNDVQEVLSAVKLYQVDNGGGHLTAINNLTDDEVYMAISGTSMTTGCNDNNANCTTNVTDADNCVDISGLVTGGYLDSMPVSPAGVVTWDDGDTSGEEGSGYTISKDANGIVTVSACEDEQTTTEIQAAR